MSKRARSARGEIVDFDLIAITQALAEAPAPVTVNARRKYIDEKENKNKTIKGVPLKNGSKQQTQLPEALKLAIESAEESKKEYTKKNNKQED
jgi:hypothetical protein